MATKFGLGTEIQSPTGLFVVFLYWILATEHGLFFCVLFQCFTAVHWMTGNSKFVLSSVSSVISKLPMAVSVHAKAVILLIKSSPVVYVLTYWIVNMLRTYTVHCYTIHTWDTDSLSVQLNSDCDFYYPMLTLLALSLALKTTLNQICCPLCKAMYIIHFNIMLYI